MKLAFVINSLGPGGAERVLANMANFWAGKGWDITLITFDDGSVRPFYALSPSVTHLPLGISGKSTSGLEKIINNFRRVCILKEKLRSCRPDVVVSFLVKTNVITLLSSLGLKVPIIVSERNYPYEEDVGPAWQWLRKKLYKKASRIVFQTQECRSFYPKGLQNKSAIIPNPVIVPKMNDKRKNGKRSDGKTMMAMGRLTPQKGFDLLLKAFASISNKHSEWSLVIWGEGKSRYDLEALRDQLGLEKKVTFPGSTPEAYQRMRLSDLFVLPSRYEGFPNVLVEAMACGLPVVSFDCPSGPRDIIRDGVDGMLVPKENVEALAQALDRMMAEETTRNRMAVNALEVNQRFSLEHIMEQWETLLLKLDTNYC